MHAHMDISNVPDISTRTDVVAGRWLCTHDLTLTIYLGQLRPMIFIARKYRECARELAADTDVCTHTHVQVIL